MHKEVEAELAALNGEAGDAKELANQVVDLQTELEAKKKDDRQGEAKVRQVEDKYKKALEDEQLKA